MAQSRTFIHRTPALAACLALGIAGNAWAGEQITWLQGLFCNTEAQVDGAIAQIGRGRTPHAAAALINDGDAVCTYVDRLHYAVDRPVEIGVNAGLAPLAKYRGTLVGVAVGDRLRPVSPPVEVFFTTPERLVDVAVERRS